MSLINDALKKAQRQRTGDSPQSQPPMPGGSVSPAHSKRGGHNSNPQLLLIGAGAVLGLMIAGGAFFFFRSKPASEPAPLATTPSVAEIAPPKTADSGPVAANPAPAVTTKSPEPALVVKAEPAVTAAPSLPAATDSTAVAEKAVEPAATATASEPPAPSLRMIEAIEALRVAGIRVGAGTDAKVLMNDRVYRVGDTVDYAQGIKLTAVTASSLTFRDTSGATYTRNF
ncbi:MAG TPA: hypothetical protein VK477_02645 [Acidobacteriota bacterium]|nr:hypothetical protein [Acidobacteriota bacterium]